MPVRVIGLFGCAAAVCVPLIAHGEGQADTSGSAVAVDYTAPPDCPVIDDFKAIVVGRLGYDAFRKDAANHVTVQIAPRSHGFEGRIEWRNAEGTWVGDRTFPSRGEDCRDLSRGMAFALALQIQLWAFAQATPSQPPATPDKVEAAPPAPRANPSVSSEKGNASVPEEPGASKGPAFAIGAGALVGFGLSSTAVPLGRLFANLAWKRIALELAAEAGWPTTTRRADGAGFSQQLLLVDVAGCGILQSWRACLLGKAGQVRIAGNNHVDVPASPSGPIVETGLRLAFIQSLGRHAFVAAQVDGLCNVVIWRVTLDQQPLNQALVWASPRFAGSVGLDAGLRFP